MAATHVSIGGSRPIKIGSTIKHGGREYRVNKDGSRTDLRSGTTYGGANPQKRKYNDRKDRWEYPRPEKGLRFYTTRRSSSKRAGSGSGSHLVSTPQKGVNASQAAGSGPGSPGVVTIPTSGGSLTFGQPIDPNHPMVPQDKQLKRIGNGGPEESIGSISDIGWVRTRTGWQVVPSQDAKERMEDNPLMEFSWIGRNVLGPQYLGGVWGDDYHRPGFLDPKYSHYSPWYNEWREGGNPRKGKDGSTYLTGGGF